MAVAKLNFEVNKGEIFAFLGVNGAGKSTTISCITTTLGFDSGSITLDDLRLVKIMKRFVIELGSYSKKS
ncbi:MAG: ATP-binding cassette domain-containing protein [Micrococcaceae bacterium]